MFSSLLFESYCPEFFELSLETIIAVSMPVSIDYATSFKYNGEKAGYVGFTFMCYMSNIMPDVFYESMKQTITCFVLLFLFGFISFVVIAAWLFSLRIVLLFSLEWKIWYQFYDYNSNGCGKILSYNRLRQIKPIGFQWDLKSKTCLLISVLDLHRGVSLPGRVMLFLTRDAEFLLHKGFCEKILIQLWTLVMDYLLPGLI